MRVSLSCNLSLKNVIGKRILYRYHRPNMIVLGHLHDWTEDGDALVRFDDGEVKVVSEKSIEILY